jgi:hypothetical protein
LVVLDDPAYRAVSGSNSTPWSRRLLARTARAGRMRVEAEQVWPGTACFLAATGVSRLLVARYAGILSEAEQDVIVEAKERTAALSGLGQCRLVASRKGGITDFWALVEFAAPTTLTALAPVLGQLGGKGADVFNLYAPYDKSGGS